MSDRLDFDYDVDFADDDENESSSLYDEVISSNYAAGPVADKAYSGDSPEDPKEKPAIGDAAQKTTSGDKAAEEKSKDIARENTFANHQDADNEIRRALHYILQKIQAVQDQQDGKAPRPKVEGEQPPLRDQIRGANKELERIHKKVNPYLTLEEKDAIAAEFWKVYLDFTRMEHGLPPGTSQDKLWDCVRKDEAKKLGLPPDSTFVQIQAEYDKHAFDESCKSYGLDPKTATEKQLNDAIKADEDRRFFLRQCEFYKLDPKKATEIDIEDAREQYRFEESCKTYGLDPKTTTRSECKQAEEKFNFEYDCKRYGLDPKTTSREEVKRVKDFRIDCAIYQIDPQDPEANKKVHKARCDYYGLPESASQKDIDEKVKEELEKYKAAEKK